jgi:cyanophycin synthetase
VLDKKNKTLEKNGNIINYKHINVRVHFDRDNKSIVKSILAENNIPVSKSYTWNTKLSSEENAQHIRALTPPYVVKPIWGEKGYGVVTDITPSEILPHIEQLKNKNVLIEEQATGKEYRIMVLNDTIIGITMKSPPQVTGDGKHTIQYLIDAYNRDKPPKYQNHTIDHQYVKKQGYTVSDILPLNKKITITHVCNMSNGAPVKYVEMNTVHEANLALFKKINQILDMKLSGIDYICDDISLPYYLTGVVVEVNPTPGIGIHYSVYPDYKKNELVDSVIDNVFA